MKREFPNSILMGHIIAVFVALVTLALCLSCGNSPTQPPSPELSIGPPSLGNVSVGQPNQLPIVGGGVQPYNWSVSAGTLPHNMSLVPDGTLNLELGMARFAPLTELAMQGCQIFTQE